MFKRLAIVVLLAAAVVSAKTYTFTISSATQVGSVQLKPGEYKLKVDGSQVVLTDIGGNRVDTNVTIEAAGKKFAQTSVSTSNTDNGARIISIELGGTSNRVVFE